MNENDFLILLQAKLDEAKSKGNVNADIEKLQNQLDKFKIQATLDPKSAQILANEIGKLVNQKIVISNISIDQSKTVKIAQQTGQQIGNAISKGVEASVNQTKNTLKSFTDLKDFSELNKSINNFHVDTSELKNYKTILDDIKNTYSEFGQVKITNEIFKDGVLEKFKVNIEQVNGDLKETKSFMMALNEDKDAFVFSGLISGSESVVQHLDKTKNAVNQTAEAINALKEKTQIDKIQLSISDKGDTTTQIKTLTDNFTKLGLSANEVKTKMSGLDTELSELKSLLNSGASNSVITTQFDKLQASLKETQNDLKATRSEYSLLVSAQQRLSKANTIETWKQKNSAATKQAQADTQAYIDSLRNLNVQMTKMEFNEISRGFKETEISMRGLNKLGASLKDQLSQAAGSFTQWLSVSSVVMALVYQLQKVPKEVIEVNSAMIELNKVSDASASDIKKYFDEAAKSAKELGSSVSDVISATADFSRLGYSLPDSAELARVATLYKNVGDGIDISEASSSIVSTMKAFKIEAEDAISIVDKFNQVGNDFAISSGEIGDALKRSASSLAVAGNTISESIGLITAGNTVVQDADTVGTALKTMSLRITSTSTELEELGEDTEFACETLSDYRDLVMGLTHNKVDIIGDDGNYKSTFKMLQEISKVWTEMNSMEQSALMKALFGARQANIGASILENFDVAEDAMKTAEEAAGSALREQEAYEKGVQYSLDRMEASFQTFANHILDSDFLKGIVDFGNGAINIIDTVTSKLGSLGTIGLGAGLFAGIKNVGSLKMFRLIIV